MRQPGEPLPARRIWRWSLPFFGAGGEDQPRVWGKLPNWVCSWQPSHKRPWNFLNLASFFLRRHVTFFKKWSFYIILPHILSFFGVSGGFRGGATITSLALHPILDATLQHFLLHLTTHLMLRCDIFSCAWHHTWCYAATSSPALHRTPDATLWHLLFCSIMIFWFLLVPARVPEFVSVLFSFFLCPERGSVPSWFPGSFWFWLGFRGLSPCFSFVSFLRNGATNELFIAHERRGNMVCCCLGSMLV